MSDETKERQLIEGYMKEYALEAGKEACNTRFMVL